MARKQLGADLSVAAGSREFQAAISTSDVDREREVLIPDGVNTREFMQSPTVFWNHNYDMPIGQATGFVREPQHVMARAKLADRPDTHEGEWFPDTVLSLIQQGVIRGVSVGFESIANRRATPKDKQQFGDEVETVHSQWKLLEFSVAPLPANQNALITAVSKGLVTKSTAGALFPMVNLEAEPRPKPPRPRPLVVILPPSRAAERATTAQQVAAMVDKRLAWHLARRAGKTFY